MLPLSILFHISTNFKKGTVFIKNERWCMTGVNLDKGALFKQRQRRLATLKKGDISRITKAEDA